MALTDNLVEFWTLNNTLVGINGNTLVSPDGLTHCVAGKIGQAWQDDPAGTYLSVDFPALINAAGTYTLAAWVYLPSDSSASVMYFETDAGDILNVFRVGHTTKRWRVYVTSGETGSSVTVQSSSAAIAAGWFHVAVTCEVALGETSVSLYVNGAQVGTTLVLAGTLCSLATTSQLLLLAGTNAPPAGTLIDAVGVWFRALSASEIATLYAGGAGIEYPFSDNTPDAFGFTPVIDADPSTAYATDAAEITGMDAGTAVSITGGEYRITGGAWTAEAGTIDPGDTLELRVTSSGESEGVVTVTVTVGTVSVDWTITTAVLGSVVTTILWGSTPDQSRILNSRIVRGMM
jgi:hypothetical protein